MKHSRGFTIIEVVLVLAIAGLIFLMVFIALPALQKGQRDSQRKNDASTIAAAVNTFKANNRGRFPTHTQIWGYVGEEGTCTTATVCEFSDLGIIHNLLSYREPHSLTTAPPAGYLRSTSEWTSERAIVVEGKKCVSTGPRPAGTTGNPEITFEDSTPGDFVVVLSLEAGSNGSGYCLDS